MLDAVRSEPHHVEGRGHGVALVAVIAGLVGAVLVLGENGPILCPFRRCTGGYCPGCGATRGAASLVRGDLAGSWSHHPWVVVAAVQAVGVVVARVFGFELSPPLERAALVVNGLIVLAIWVVRLRYGWIPQPGSPSLRALLSPGV